MPRVAARSDSLLGLGVHEVGDVPLAQTAEQLGEGGAIIRVAARQDEKAARPRHAILRIILP